MSITQVQAILNGDRLAITRALSHIENDTSEGAQILEALFPHTGQAHLIGVTGSPGTGKSTLVNQLALAFRRSKDGSNPPSIAVIAVDPTSPFSGGALLGDRVRMQDLAGDPGIFVRSMASRGSLGGLASTTVGLAQVFDAAGFNIVLIETVGAGQAEVDIARLAHTTIVVEAPGLGDEIQTIKAGILEIADILVVNKADKPGAENAIRALRAMFSLAHPDSVPFTHHGEVMETTSIPEEIQGENWVPPILATISTTGEGIEELRQQLVNHYHYLRTSGEWQVREATRLKKELENLLQAGLKLHWESSISPLEYDRLLSQVINRQLAPRQAVNELLEGAGL